MIINIKSAEQIEWSHKVFDCIDKVALIEATIISGKLHDYQTEKKRLEKEISEGLELKAQLTFLEKKASKELGIGQTDLKRLVQAANEQEKGYVLNLKKELALIEQEIATCKEYKLRIKELWATAERQIGPKPKTVWRNA